MINLQPYAENIVAALKSCHEILKKADVEYHTAQNIRRDSEKDSDLNEEILDQQIERMADVATIIEGSINQLAVASNLLVELFMMPEEKYLATYTFDINMYPDELDEDDEEIK